MDPEKFSEQFNQNEQEIANWNEFMNSQRRRKLLVPSRPEEPKDDPSSE